MTNPAAKFVLVIEDDVNLCRSMEGALQAAGFQAIGVHTVRDAVAKLKKQTFACVLLDIQLDDERGEEVLEIMRNRPDVPNHATPVIVVSGILDRAVTAGLAGKVQGALVKPFQGAALIAMVKKHA